MKRKRYVVMELDNDYRVITDHCVKEFDDEEEAEDYCKEHSWSGHSYFVQDRDDYH